MSQANSRRDLLLGGSALMAAATFGARPTQAQQTRTPAAAARTAATATAAGRRQPNILFIMADDIGWSNIRAYNRGLMNTDTPNLDRLATEGMLFTDYYAEASCTAGRANFITGELPIRTGLTTVGQAGATIGMPAQAPTIATVLRSMGYKTAQFGKNHLGDRNEFLPTLHGFDEFFGYLYHLDAMEDPFWHSYPQSARNEVGPRNLVRSFATSVDDPTVDPRWGKVGKQRIIDEGPLPPRPMPGIRYNMHTFDEVITENVKDFIDRSVEDGKPFFCWMNPTRMHVITHLSQHYQQQMDGQNGWYEEEAGMKQLDDNIGMVMEHLKAKGVDDNTIVVFTTDNGAENFSWPDGANTPFAGGKGTAMEGGFRVPCLARWPNHIPGGKVENGIISGLDWFPTFISMAGDPDIKAELRQGKDLGGTTYKVHLDGYDQTPMLTGRGPSNRNEIFYFTESNLAAVRIGDFKYRFFDQPDGWFGGTVQLDWPTVTNLRLDPYERMGMPSPGGRGSINYYNFYAHEFWRFVYVQREVASYAQTFVEFPPMQRGASFNMEAVRQQVEQAIERARRVTQ